MPVSAGRKSYLDYLKAISIALVVAGHAISYFQTAYGGITPGWELANTLIYSVHVPLFFAVAGYLCHRQNIRVYLRKKASRVLVPYFTFAALKLVYNMFISEEFAHGGPAGEQLYDAFVLGRSYWFCYAIFLVYMIAPLFWEKDGVPARVTRRRTALALAAVTAVNAVQVITGTGIFPALFQMHRAFQYSVFFLAGMVIRQNEAAFLRGVKKYGLWITGVSAAVIVGVSRLLWIDRLADTFLTKLLLAFPLMFFLYMGAKKLPENIRPLSVMGKYSFQIMLLDSFFRVVLMKGAARLVAMNIWVALGTSFVNIALGCAACTVIEKIPFLKKSVGL